MLPVCAVTVLAFALERAKGSKRARVARYIITCAVASAAVLQPLRVI